MSKNELKKRTMEVLLAGMIGVMLLAGCSSDATTQDTSGGTARNETSGETAAADDEGKGDASAASEAEEESISREDLEAGIENAVPFDGEIQAVLHTSSGEEIVLNPSNISKDAKAAFSALAGRERKWIRVTGAYATTTLPAGKYNYSVYNMLDWDTKTCWAEGESRSEGLWEGFAYYSNGVTRIDGFRIYPGYQKSKSVYRNNILPRGLTVSVGGYEINCDLDPWLQDITRDGDWYWIDITFSSPVYDDYMYTMITAVGTYGSDPDKDCCITEFHPFHY